MEFQKVLGIFDNMMENRIQVGRFGGLRHLWVDHAGPHSQVSKNTTQRWMVNDKVICKSFQTKFFSAPPLSSTGPHFIARSADW